MAVDIKVESHHDHQGAARIKNLPAPGAADDPIRQTDLDSAIAALRGRAWKDNVRVATQGNLNLASPGATIDGVTMSADDRVLVHVQTATEENGIYTWNGAAAAMTRTNDADSAEALEGAVTVVDEGTDAGVTYRQTAVNFILDTDPVTWVVFGDTTPAATEGTAGKSELATQGETDTGTDDARIVTPLKLKTTTLRAKGGSTLIGDNSSTQFDLTHNHGTRKVLVCVRRNASPWDEVQVGNECPDANTVRLNFVSAPTTDEFEVSVITVPSA